MDQASELFYEDKSKGIHYLAANKKNIKEFSFADSLALKPRQKKNSASAAAWVDDEAMTVDIVSQNRTKKLRKNLKESSLESSDYENRLRSQFERTNPLPKWASWNQDAPAAIEAPLTYSAASSDALLSGFIDIERLPDINLQDTVDCVIRSIHFHPSSEYLVTAGYDKTLRFYKPTERSSQKIQGIHIPDMPVSKAMFSTDGTQVVATGRRKFFYCCDFESSKVSRVNGIIGRTENYFDQFFFSPCGKYMAVIGYAGAVMLLSSKTFQLVSLVQIDGQANSIDFSADGKSMFVFGKSHVVYEWSMDKFRCVRSFNDHGAINGTAISIAGSGHVATGGSDGVVNIYHRDKIGDFNPVPIKSVQNITRSISGLKFHSSSQILAAYSDKQKDGLRLVHLPSGTVFQNWPSPKTPLGYIHSVDFSPSGKLLAMGNDKGKVLLYKLKHFA